MSLELYITDNGELKQVPEYQTTFCFETEEEMNRFEKRIQKWNKYRWHDLINNPDELPEPGTLALVCCECIDGRTYDCQIWLGDFWNCKISEGYERVAWREIEGYGDEDDDD